jgi:hypothetical protein
MMLKKLALLTTTLISFNQAHATEWLEITQSDEKKYYISPEHTNPISRAGTQATELEMWVKSVIYNDLTKDGMTINDYQMLLYKIDCRNREFGIKQGVNYNAKGKMLDSNSTNTVTMNRAIPETIGASIVSSGCTILDILNNPEKYS